jgi:uncharacterized membrane protein YfcA
MWGSNNAQSFFGNSFFKLAIAISSFIPFLILISIAGSYIGKLVLNKMPQKYFRNIVLIVIVSISIYSISKYF